jgi:uncharacterized membrane protein YoaK (UPF0700 family)
MTHTLLAEEVLLVVFAAVWHIGEGPSSDSLLYGLIALSAIAMGLQGAVGRALALPGVPTIVITSTLTAVIGTAAERALRRGHQAAAPATRHQLVSLFAYLSGAVIAGGLVSRWLGLLPFVPVALILVLIAGFRPYLVPR